MHYLIVTVASTACVLAADHKTVHLLELAMLPIACSGQTAPDAYAPAESTRRNPNSPKTYLQLHHGMTLFKGRCKGPETPEGKLCSAL